MKGENKRRDNAKFLLQAIGVMLTFTTILLGVAYVADIRLRFLGGVMLFAVVIFLYYFGKRI